MEFSDKKLNILQRGILQKVIILLTYAIGTSILASLIDWIDKQWFISVINEYHNNGKLSEKAVNVFSIVIESRGSIAIFVIISILVIYGILCFIFMRRTAQLNWSYSVVLDKVVEFRNAMESIGIFNPEERFDFIIKSKVPLYIAHSPIIGKEKEKVKVKFYAFANYDYLSSADTIDKYTGNRFCVLNQMIMSIYSKHTEKKRSPHSCRKFQILKQLSKISRAHSHSCSKIWILLREKRKTWKKKTGNSAIDCKLSLPGRETRKKENMKESRSGWWLCSWSTGL